MKKKLKTPQESNESVSFISRLEPVLKSGNYTFTLTQNVKSKPDIVPSFESTIPALSKNVLIASERFIFNSPLIQSVFPPINNVGDHSASIPHVVLNRASLPWERNVNTNGTDSVPWLAVIVIFESDFNLKLAEFINTVKLNDVVNFTGSERGKIRMQKEVGQNMSEQLSVLKLKKSFAQKIIPNTADLKLMASVRRNSTDNAPAIELATCYANRLPAIGEKSYAFLVSMEERYTQTGDFDYANGIDDNDFILLISLLNWNFSCPDVKEFELNNVSTRKLGDENLINIVLNPSETVGSYLKKVLEEDALYRGTEELKARLPDIFNSKSLTEPDKQKILNCLRAPTKTFEGILQKVHKSDFKPNVPSLENNEFALPYLLRSSIVMEHHLREGQKTASWYHGPLITGKDPQMPPQTLAPILSSDVLYRYDEQINMLDVSYSAAWQLGRLLMLNNPQLAASLFGWKQKNFQHLIEDERSILDDQLPFSKGEPKELEEKLQSWFSDLNLLYGVPFNYLVPEPSMLPVESIRFFELDNYWLACLLDGAFSIGRISKKEQGMDNKMVKMGISYESASNNITGFMLRSDVVSGWPSLIVDGYASPQPYEDITGTPLKILRISRLSPDILICLFEGVVNTVDIHLLPESLHMGFDDIDELHPDYSKQLRDLEKGEMLDVFTNIVWKDQDLRIINMSGLAAEMDKKLNRQNSLTSGQFALEMIEGVPRVRFNSVS